MTAPHEKELDFIYQLHGGQRQVPDALLQKSPDIRPLDPCWASPSGIRIQGHALKEESRGWERGEVGCLSPSRPVAFQPQLMEEAGWKWDKTMVLTGLDILVRKIRLLVTYGIYYRRVIEKNVCH